VVRVFFRILRKRLRFYRIYFLKYSLCSFRIFCHLQCSLVTTRFQKCRRNGHRPDSCVHNLLYIEVIRTAGIGDPKSAVKFRGKLRRKRNRQWIERFPGHIHFFTWKFLLFYIHRECIRDLHTELQSLLLTEHHKPCQHRNCIFILKIIFKMKITKGYIVISHLIHRLSCELISKKRWIAFDKRMESFLSDQIICNLLNLLRRASM